MIKRALTYLIVTPIAVALIALGVVNTHPVELILDPFRADNPAVSVSLPFYAYLFACLAIGIIVGGWVTWRSQAHWRREARRRGAEAQRWHGEADRLARERDVLLKEQAGSGAGPKSALRQIASR